MTSQELKQIINDRLDNGGFWSDEEIYKALTEAQYFIVDYLVKSHKLLHTLLETIETIDGKIGSGEVFSVSVKFDDEKGDYIPARLISEEQYNIIRDNHLLEPTQEDPVAYQNGVEIRTVPSAESVLVTQLKEITEIDASNNSMLDDRVIPIMIDYAVGTLMMKDPDRAQEGNAIKANAIKQLGVL